MPSVLSIALLGAAALLDTAAASTAADVSTLPEGPDHTSPVTEDSWIASKVHRLLPTREIIQDFDLSRNWISAGIPGMHEEFTLHGSNLKSFSTSFSRVRSIRDIGLLAPAVHALNCSGQQRAASRCVEARHEDAAALPGTQYLLEIHPLGSSGLHTCANSTIVLPADLSRFQNMVNRVFSSPVLKTNRQRHKCWQMGTFPETSSPGPLLARVDPSGLQLSISDVFLPAESEATDQRIRGLYEDLLDRLAFAATEEDVLASGVHLWHAAVQGHLAQFRQTHVPEQSPIRSALECAGCIVVLTFVDLIVANFGGLELGCALCGCFHLSSPTCTALLQSVLYIVIAILPLLAVGIFEGCKGLCLGEPTSM